MTVDDVMNLTMPAADEKDAALPAPPASRVLLSPFTGEAMELSYGIHPGYWVRILWALALAPFAIGGIARMIGASGATTLDAIAARVPLVRETSDLAVAYPVPFVLVTFVFWAVPTWSMLHVPRAARIDRQGVHVTKRLWPPGKTYRIETIRSVQVNEFQVVLQRKHASLWRRFVAPAPPMPSKEAARWLGAQFRRALAGVGGLKRG